MHMTSAISARHVVLSLTLLWLAGIGLRLTILAPPPVISLVHADLAMTETEVGILSGLPALLFALAAVPGSLLIARFGALSALIIGLLATAAGSALRGAAPNVALLFAATVLTGFGVAVMQPAMPPLVRAWLPNRIGFATAVYTNGLLVGEILPVALTLPLVMPLMGDSWRWSFVVWGALCALIALVIWPLAPRPVNPAADAAAPPRLWWPNWRSPLIWQLGAMLGSVNAMYFSVNFFMPRYLHETGRDADISAALTSLNVGQLPASILLLMVASGLERRRWPYLACGVLCLAAVLAIVLGNSLVVIAGAGLLGFSAAAVLVLMLVLPPLLSPPHDVHRTAAAMFTISYSCAVVTPILSGLAWDLTGVPAAAFVPIGLCAFLMIVPASRITIRPH
ncbi:MAG TPA: MFS transporter [Xanthobacteraceae bacterium]|nr:MFS transporter [Xanthobacteraceae bacterium]